MGTWVDEVIIVEEPDVFTAISRLRAGDIDIWATASSNATAFESVRTDPPSATCQHLVLTASLPTTRC